MRAILLLVVLMTPLAFALPNPELTIGRACFEDTCTKGFVYVFVPAHITECTPEGPCECWVEVWRESNGIFGLQRRWTGSTRPDTPVDTSPTGSDPQLC